MEERLKNVLIINGHQPYPFAKGRLNGTLVALAREHLERGGYHVELTEVSKGWDVETELARRSQKDETPGVDQGFVLASKWLPLQDSNLRPSD